MDIYIFYLFLSLAVLTKSAAALLFLPGLVVYALLTRQFLPLLKNRHIYIGLLIPIVLVGGYYVGREWAEPGYLRAVWANEFGGRYLTVIEGHRESILFYVKKLCGSRFSYWVFMAIGGTIFGLFGSDRRVYRLTLFAVVLSGVYLLVISLAKTKLFWYDIPLYPFLALLAAVFVFKIFELLKRHAGKWAAYVFLVCLLASPLVQIYKTGYMPRETTDWEVDTHIKTRYLRDMWRHPENMIPGRSYAVIDDAYHAQHLFYIYLLRDNGYPVRLTRREDLQAGDVVLCDQTETADFLQRKFETALLLKDRVLEIYDLKAERAAETEAGCGVPYRSVPDACMSGHPSDGQSGLPE